MKTRLGRRFSSFQRSFPWLFLVSVLLSMGCQPNATPDESPSTPEPSVPSKPAVETGAPTKDKTTENAAGDVDPGDADPTHAPEGLWRVPHDAQRVEQGNTVFGPGHRWFAFDGETVVVHLFTEKQFMWRTLDEHYRLETRWEDDRLEYRPPFGQWTSLARFDGSVFFTVEQGHRFEYERIAADETQGDEGALIVPRAAHDYSTNAIDQPAWRKGVPEYLWHWPGLYAHRDGELVEAPGPDVALARNYPLWKTKGAAVDGHRLSIASAQATYAVGEEVRVVHVLEVVEPGHEVFVMGPKPIYGEHVDGVRQGEVPPDSAYPWVGVYDGAVLESPNVDYNFAVTAYQFDAPGPHEIVWRPGTWSSNTLRIEVTAASP